MHPIFTLTAMAFSLQHSASAQNDTSSCAPCDSLRSRWNPDSNTGSCVGRNTPDPVKYIVNFEQCICSNSSLSDYAACAKCDINGDGGVRIDGLNFGPPAEFSKACSIFAADVTSVLQPSGLNAFASKVLPLMTASRSDVDILGYYAFQNVVTATKGGIGNTGGGIVTDSTVPTAPMVTSTASTGKSTLIPSNFFSAGSSEGVRNQTPIAALLAMLGIAISAAFWL